MYWVRPLQRLQNFYPRSPCGERPRFSSGAKGFWGFLSTLSLRRATCLSVQFGVSVSLFLSTLSLRRATTFIITILTCRNDFYPRSPCGERRIVCDNVGDGQNFYPRSPCGERPDKYQAGVAVTGISIHALLAESDITDKMSEEYKKLISIHALLAESDGGGCKAIIRDINISIHALLAESDELPLLAVLPA